MKFIKTKISIEKPLNVVEKQHETTTVVELLEIFFRIMNIEFIQKSIKFFNMEMNAPVTRIKQCLLLILFSFLSMSSVGLYGQCENDENDPVFSNCDDQTIVLDQGICTTQLNPLLSATDDCTGHEYIYSLNNDNVSPDQGFGCSVGYTSFYQIFSPANSTRYTPISITNVEIGVNESYNNPTVEVKIYITDGSLNPSNWTEVGSANAVLPILSNTLHSIPVTSTEILPNQTFAIEVITPTSSIYGAIAGIGSVSQSAPTYFRSSACGVNTLTDIITEFGADTGLVLNVSADADGLAITSGNVNTPAPDFNFSEGVYNLLYVATDAVGNSSTCSLTLTVEGTSGVVSSIACDDKIQVSLDDECEAVITADEVLEGGPYSCYGDYIVTLYNKLNQPIGNIVNEAYIGQTLKVSVTDNNGNSCWGLVLIEDKNPTPLECEDVYTTCESSLKPGTLQPSRITVPASLGNGVIPTNALYARDYIVNVFGLGGADITDVDVIVDIEHTNINDLVVLVTSPGGITVPLFSNLAASCVNTQNLELTFDDEAVLNYANLLALCNPDAPAVSGIFKPAQSLSAFNNESAEGEWIITVLDTVAANGGIINDLKLVFSQQGGIIPFPTTNPVTFQELGTGYYIVNGIDACGPATLGYTDVILREDCLTDYAKIIARTWVATDAAGNASQACTQYIYVYRNGLETLRFPPNYDGIDEDALSCSDWGTEVPGPIVTGYPEGDFCSNVQIYPHEDLILDVCDKSYKVVRKWRVVEWCTAEIVEHTQIIKVLDEEGPYVICPEDVTITTDPLECTLDYSPARPTILEECSDEVEYELSYYLPDPTGVLPLDAVFTTNVNNHTIFGVPYGRIYVRWVLTDDCHNKTECIHEVEVIDEIPPIAVCDQFTKVSIGAYGIADVEAYTFDDISNDNCGIEKFEARKMTNKCGGTNIFRDYVTFCCAEVGDSIQVEMRVTDISGNSNTCMVWVKIDDKLPPHIFCPDDITINCQADFKNLDITGRPEYIDNCVDVTLEHVDSGSPDQCGEGLIRRTFTVKDKKGLAASCVQRIYLVDDDPFWVNEQNHLDPNDDVIWPLDYNATTCHQNLNPENLPAGYGYPTILDDDCSLTSALYKDQTFVFVDGSCEKILRTWTIIDWCTYDEISGEGYYTHLQIIKLQNLIKPEFTSCADLTVDVFGNCEGLVSLSKGATDDCTPVDQLKYTYVIDLYNDGIVNLGYSGNSNKVERVLPIGKHKVTWTVEDKCGNRTTCVEILTVRDGKKPTPYCLSTVTTVVMPSSKMIEIWARDFDHGSFDNCTPQNQLIFTFDGALPVPSKINEEHYFKGNGILATADEYAAGLAQRWIPGTKTSGMKFDCEDIPDGIQETITLKMTVTDLEGNQDYCTVTLILQDNTGDACDDNVGSRVDLGGKIKTENNKSLNGAMVTLLNANNVIVEQKMTTTDGQFKIDNVSANKNYSLKVDKNNDVINGVSTLDLVLIQRHILGIDKLNSPYKLIAADASNDAKITANDLVALRKVILGLSTAFPNNQKSWRFLDAAQTFANPASPFPFSEIIKLDNINSDMFNQDFYAVKIGDVNGSIVLNATEDNSEPRSQRNLDLAYDFTKDGEHTVIDFYSNETINLLGFQTALQMRGLEQVEVISGALQMNKDYFNFTGDNLLMSWTTDRSQELDANVKLFSIKVKGDVDGLNLSNDLNSESYFSMDEISGINLIKRNLGAINNSFEVYQNQPNPFAKQTTIGFKIPEAGKVTLKVYDQTGKILYKESKEFEAGVNNFMVEQHQLKVTGIMYYEISSQQYKATRKMVGLN